MIYAAVIVCGLSGCISFTDNRGPYLTEAACRARQDEMRPVIAMAAASIGPHVVRELCGTLDEVRRHLPGAFEGEQTT